MDGTLERVRADRLERSGTARPDSIQFGLSAPGLERAEVFIGSRGYAPHRHDTYAIGITTFGLQTFVYRGARRACLPGQVHVLHPDETHDGAPGTDGGFGYRILYIAPELVREALGRLPLPFVAEPVPRPTPATRRLASVLLDINEPITDLGRIDIAAMVADLLSSVSGGPSPRDTDQIDLRAVELARAHLATHAREQTSAAMLERIAGLDRYTLTRHFRRAFGTSPDRYRAMRRLGFARAAIEGGAGLAEAAAYAGFADQSHMTRQFKRAYGLTPARWRAATHTARRDSPARPRDN